MDRAAGLPRVAAWRHRDLRDGFEVVFVEAGSAGVRLDGRCAAVEGGTAWFVEYAIDVGPDWRTRTAHVSGRSAVGAYALLIETDGAGSWQVGGAPAQHLEGCLDVDLEASALTNAFPVHRLGLEVGQAADAPAAYVRATEPTVERLEQRYVRLSDEGGRERYQYRAPAFAFECELVYDEFGLVVEYPGIATRVA